MDYSKYHFNYFDVIKRHERIINRPKDWEIKILAIIMLIVTFVYTFANFGFCSEVEEVEFTSITGLAITNNNNYFTSNANATTGYFQLEQGYIYHITYDGNSLVFLALSDETPAVNVTYDFLTSLSSGNTYNYISNSANEYLYFSFRNTSGVSVTREKLANYEGAVNDLVDNVGVNQIWGVFNNGISFVGVVVLVAFGLFLVVLAIKKVSKGKSDF